MKSVCIIIPTRERARTLHFTIKSCLNQNYENLKILVCDNFSSDNTRSVVESFDDERLFYINPGKRLPMSKNWDFALENCNEDYVTIIGDDDAFLPDSIKVLVDLLDKYQCSAVSWKKAEYTWPDYPKKMWANKLIFPAKHRLFRIKGKTAFELIFNFHMGYNCGPSLYNAIVSRDTIQKIIATEGRVFKSRCPDVYSSLVFSKLLEDYLYLTYPISINGASGQSNGTSSMNCVKETSYSDSPREKFAKENYGANFYKEIEFSLVKGSITAAITDSFLVLRDESSFSCPKINFKRIFSRIISECVINNTLDKENIELIKNLAKKRLSASNYERLLAQLSPHLVDVGLIEESVPSLVGNIAKGESTLDVSFMGVSNVFDAGLLLKLILNSSKFPEKTENLGKIGFFIGKAFQKMFSSSINHGI